MKHVPLDAVHRELKARMVPFAGYEMPVQYEGLVKEHHAVRNDAGVFDVSHMGEIFVRGKDAASFVDGLVTGHVVNLPVGKAVYTLGLNAEGTLLDDLIVYKLAENEVLIVCNASNQPKISAHLHAERKRSSLKFELTDESDAWSLLAVQGPHAWAKAKSSGLQIADLYSYEVARGTWNDSGTSIDVIIARTGYTGEDGFEVFVKNGSVESIFRSLLQSGVVPVGLGARDTLRLEARLSLYGNEIDETTEPFEAGLAWVVKMDKETFLGKEALANIQANPSRRKLVGLEMVGRGIARHGYPVVDATGKTIGVITSGSPSPSTGKNIALGYVPVEQSSVGTKILVRIREQDIEAVVAKTPFYKTAHPSPKRPVATT